MSQMTAVWAVALSIASPAILFYSVNTVTVESDSGTDHVSSFTFCSLVDDHGMLGVARRAHTILTAGVWIGLTSSLIALNNRVNKLILEKVHREMNAAGAAMRLDRGNVDTVAVPQNEDIGDAPAPTEQNGSERVPTSSTADVEHVEGSNSNNNAAAATTTPYSTERSNRTGGGAAVASGGVPAEIDRSFSRRALSDLHKAHRAHMIVSAICSSAWFLVVVEEPLVESLVFQFSGSTIVAYIVEYIVRTGPLIALYAKLAVLLGMEPTLRRTRPLCLRRLGR